MAALTPQDRAIQIANQLIALAPQLVALQEQMAALTNAYAANGVLGILQGPPSAAKQGDGSLGTPGTPTFGQYVVGGATALSKAVTTGQVDAIVTTVIPALQTALAGTAVNAAVQALAN